MRRERIAIDVAAAQLEASRGAFDFRLSADAVFSRRTTPPISAQDLQGGASNNLNLDLGIQRALETGGALSLTARTSASDSNSRLECGTIEGRAIDCTVYNSGVNLGFSHPLLRGFGTEIAQANIRRKRVQQDQALLNRQMRAANIIRDVINTYWGLSYATQNLAIRRSAVDLAREQLRVTQAQIDVGRLAPVDAAAVERAIGERQQEVLVSEQELLFRTLELRRLFGLPAEVNLPIYSAADVPQSVPRDVDLAGRDHPGAGDEPPAALDCPGHETDGDRHRGRPVEPATAAGLRGPGGRHRPPAGAGGRPGPGGRLRGPDLVRRA